MSALVHFIFPSDPTLKGALPTLLLILRIIFGGMMLAHGVEKWSHFREIAATFPDPLGIGSSLTLVLAIFAEVFCSVALIVGCLSRIALAVLIINMMVAAFVVHHGSPFAGKELALIYLFVFTLLFIWGAGRYSIDGMIGNLIRENESHQELSHHTPSQTSQPTFNPDGQ